MGVLKFGLMFWFDTDQLSSATFSGPRTFAESTRLAPKPLNAEKKKSSRIDIPSPKTPKAWPSIEEPDISTLPSPETADRNLLEARLKLAGEITRKEALGSGNDECPQFDDLLQTYILVPRPIRGRNQRRSPYSSTKEITKSIEHVQSQSPSNEQRARSPSDGRDKSKNLHGKTTMLEPTSTNNLISRSPSPTFDFDDSEITDIESDTEFDETSNERLSRCETLSSQEPHSPLSDKPPKPLEKDWKFRFQRDCATGTLRTLESPSMHSSASQPPHELRRSKNRKFEGAGLSNYNVKYPTNYSQPIHTDRPRQMSAESRCSARSHIIPPPRKTSPPIIAPIHRDQMRERGASFEPESRTPRTLVANWLTSISSNAGRSREQQQQPPREHDVFWKKTRSWGRKSKPRLDGWI